MSVRKTKRQPSLSARRAWIEILLCLSFFTFEIVALRKESVDRNLIGCINRAINIIVALRKESVDRNFDAMQIIIVVMCRSPQGERG